MLADIPEPLPGEHVHSILARFHVLEGKGDFRKTINELLPKDRELNNKFLWRASFEYIWQRYQGILGREPLLQEHTSFKFDAKFITTELVTAISDSSFIDNIAYSGSKNLNTNRVWRWCPECVHENTARYGMRFWHVVHQIPSIVSCPNHNLMLNYGCTNCHFSQQNLKNFELPQRNNKCPLCQQPMQYIEAGINEEREWLQSLTLKLFHSKATSRLCLIKTALKQALGLPDSEFELSREQRAKIKPYKKEMIHSVFHGEYQYYFDFGSASGDRVATPYSINLIHLMYRDPLYPPLCYLAALRLFYSQTFIEQLLLD
ncbi:MAG: hypothetical protein ACI9YH_000161 [Colwellia sp.]|jgi:hypothetical protein